MEETRWGDYTTIIKKIFKWVILSIIMSIPIGIIVAYYNVILTAANKYRKSQEYSIYFLPLAGLLVTFMYLRTERNAYSGENLLKSEVQSAVKDIPFYMTFVFLGSLAITFLWISWKIRISGNYGQHKYYEEIRKEEYKI